MIYAVATLTSQLASVLSIRRSHRQAEGVSDFEWSPKDNVLAYWAPEQANAPARVSVVEIPSRKELRQKNLVMVSECRLHWQASTWLVVDISAPPLKLRVIVYSNNPCFLVRIDIVILIYQ